MVCATPAPAAAADAPWQLRIEARAPSRSSLVPADGAERIRQAGTLGGGPKDCCIAGWVDYDFGVPERGWYELFALEAVSETEFIIDPSSPTAYAYGTASVENGMAKIVNAWLAAGAHTLRVQRYFWTGLPRLSGFLMRKGGTRLDAAMQVSSAEPRIYRLGACPPLELRAGGQALAARLGVYATAKFGDPGKRIAQLAVTPSTLPQQYMVSIPCDTEGAFSLVFADAAGAIPWTRVRPVNYEVVDTRAAAGASGAEATFSAPVLDFDAASRDPDYSGGGGTRVVHQSFGAYRESADGGWTEWQRAGTAQRMLMSEPAWFAYRMAGVAAQQPYSVEVDVPDDGLRSEAIALRESSPLAYPVAGGVDTGGGFGQSNAFQKSTVIFWPRAPEPRLVIMNAHSGSRAAAGHVVVRRIDGPLPPLLPAAGRGGREFINWYEEGTNFLSLYGMRDDGSSAALQEAVSRWAESAAYAGATILMPTVAVYESVLYPSQFNRTFSKPDQDLLRRIVLAAEKRGLKVIAELHPRSDELDIAGPGANLSVSKEGTTNFFQGDGKTRNYPALHDPLNPDVREWYLGMITELAQRYRDSPAFAGVSVRLWQWANPGLAHFHSLDWGYGEIAFGRFVKEAGIVPPPALLSGNGASAAKARYQWIVQSARDEWVKWRCAKVAELFAEMRSRVAAVRADLKIVANLTVWPGQEHALAQAWREAGIDPALLRAIDGVRVLDATASYGRRETASVEDPLLRELMVQAGTLSSAGRAFLTPANYLEATDAIVPPDALGFAPQTKRTWMSAVANPAGRSALERFAVLLAESDADWLGDGGNGYALGQPPLRGFLREYLSLPSERFTQVGSADVPVVVRTLSRSDGIWFYAVNRAPHGARVLFEMSAATSITRPGDGSVQPTSGSGFTVSLLPFELAVFRADPGASIAWIEVQLDQ